MVTENSKFGVIIGTVQAEDLDENKTIIYSIDNTTELGKLIYLDSDHGDIVVANKIDREENEWLNITVTSIIILSNCNKVKNLFFLGKSNR